MRKLFLTDLKRGILFLSLAIFLLPCNYLFAQKLQLSEFVVYVNTDTVSQNSISKFSAKGHGVQIGEGSKILSGSTGSCYPIKTMGAAHFSGDIHSGSTIHFETGNTVKGNITSANYSLFEKYAFHAGDNFSLKGNLDVKGNIFAGKNSIIDGAVTHPAGTQYSGPVPTGGEKTGKPALPVLPKNAAITNFDPAGNTDITASQTITPGSYGEIKLTGNNTIVFSGPGVYIFNAIINNGDLNKFVFDFKNSADGIFELQIHGDVNLGKFQAIINNGGSASRIYAETHGNGATCPYGSFAWSMDNCVVEASEWKGTIYAPFAGIHIGSAEGSAKIKGALWSGTQVRILNNVEIELVSLRPCISPDVSAGEDKELSCTDTTVVLNGSSSTPGAKYCWVAIDSGFIVTGAKTPTPTVSKAGTYVLTVIDPNGRCKASDTAVVQFIPCIFPYYPPPEDGKIENLIGAELNSLYENFDNVEDTLNDIFTIIGDSVLVEVIALQGKYDELLALLQTPAYGITNLVNNGPNSLIITGIYPIANLKKLDSLPELVNYCRPVYPPLGNSGVVNSAGDTSLYTHFARGGFDIAGQGVKVGVISNSYNTIPGNPAQTDVLNGDLPGIGNPDNSTPVNVLRDYPYGRSTDEGRAMLQIVHDIAPKAELSFRTGFISAGDFAEGIKALQEDGCDIIVDDVTFITEPFFEDGVISKAVDEVTAEGVSYFTAAGNFGNKSYRHAFIPIPAPDNMSGFAHDFGGGDIYQSLTLVPGTYTIVLQWQDDIYSLNPAGGGAKNDFDIYLRDNNGNTLFGFNRNNLGGDPIEVIPFTVTIGSQTNIMIIRAAGTDNPDVKYMVFRGEPVINEYSSGTATIVGQANAEGAMTVGAVLYTNTPAYGVNPPTIASFSSAGGNAINGIVRSKPDFTGPNGTNTTVYLGGTNIDGDLFPNFFGTSAAAPHIAGVAALVTEARQKFYSEKINPQQMRSLLQNTAVEMADPGFDFISGYGLVQADSALRSFAAPTPSISKLLLPDTSIHPGEEPFTVTVQGNYLSDQSVILFRGDPLQTTVLNSSFASATIPEFTGNPPIQVYTAPIAPNGNDGGYSDSLFFFSPVKKDIVVTARNETKRYGEMMPDFAVDITIDSIPLDSTDYTLEQLGLDSIYFITPATSLSNTGIYFIRPQVKPFDPEDSSDIALLEMYNYTFKDGLLSIEKMPLMITAKDTTLDYGEKLGSFNYNFVYPDSLIAEGDKNVFFDSLETGYLRELADATALADARQLVNGRQLVNADLENLSFLASGRAVINARQLVNARQIVNISNPDQESEQIIDTTLIVDIAVESIFNYQEDSATAVLVNARQLVNARALVNASPLVNGTATVNARQLVNGSSQVNGESVGDSSQSDIAVIIDEEDVNAPPEDTLTIYRSINLVTGTTTGQFAIVPGAFITENFDVQYALGALNINPYKLIVKANNVTTAYGNIPSLTSTITGFQYDDNDSSVLASQPAYTILDDENNPVTDSIIPAGTYTIVPGDLQFIGDTVNYIPEYVNGILVVSPAALNVKADNKVTYAGCDLPEFTSTITGFVGNDSNTIVSGPDYIVDPKYTGKPGIYSIIPCNLKLAVQGNYTITYTPGNLYVNPDKRTSKKIVPQLECIEIVTDTTKGFKYVGHFSYTNENKTPVFIPIGPDNNIKSTGAYSGIQPELFMPGVNYFDVYSNGPLLVWTIKSYQCNIKVTEKAVACSTSQKCNTVIAAASAASVQEKETVSANATGLKIYPNPVVDKVTVQFGSGTISSKDISLFDIMGKSYPVRIISSSNNNIILNLSQLSRGMYVIKLKTGEGSKSFMIVKE